MKLNFVNFFRSPAILDTFMAPLEKFKACVESYHYPSSDLIRIYENMTKLMPAYAGGITSEAEMMMAIAQMSSESKGFSSTREEACISEPPPERCRYAGDPKYKCNENATNAFYFGRGYIQITGCLNYRAASFALYNDDRLVRNPDLVASDPMVNLEASLWFWKRNVHSRKGVTEGDFGATTKAIHGTGACKNPKWIPNSKLRYKQFIKCLQASGLYDDLKGKVNESGCYPLTKFAKNNHQSIFNFIRYPKLYRQRYVYYWI